jgi:hypothetical protein
VVEIEVVGDFLEIVGGIHRPSDFSQVRILCHARVHLLLIEEFTTRDLVDSQLRLRVEPVFLGQEPVDGFGSQLGALRPVRADRLASAAA